MHRIALIILILFISITFDYIETHTIISENYEIRELPFNRYSNDNSNSSSFNKTAHLIKLEKIKQRKEMLKMMRKTS